MGDGASQRGRPSQRTVWCAAVLAAVTLLGATNALSSTHEEVLALQADVRTTVLSEHLLVNVDATRRHVFLRKCQIDGERELVRLSVQSTLEESFIFIPSLCVWIESGYNETANSVRMDKDFLYSVARQYEHVAIYHIQPDRGPSAGRHFPSYRDFVSMVLINGDFLDEPNVEITHRAVTAYAVIDYGFSDWSSVQDRARLYRQKGLGRHLSQNLAYEYSGEKYLQDYLRQVRLCVEQVQDSPSRIAECRRFATDLFLLEIRAVQLVAEDRPRPAVQGLPGTDRDPTPDIEAHSRLPAE